MNACHWFRSDLRLDDNTGLHAAASAADALHLVFVLDDRLLESTRQGGPRLAFLRDSLVSLADTLAARGQVLHVEHGDPVRIFERLQSTHRFDLVTWNRDDGPFARRRDTEVAAVVRRGGAEVRTFKDRVLFESDEVLTQDGRPYSVFTPYRKRWQDLLEGKLQGSLGLPRLPPPVVADAAEMPAIEHAEPAPLEPPTAGETAARDRLDAFLDSPALDYDTLRNDVAQEGTSRLGPYLRFGVISPRECVRRALEAQQSAPRREGLEAWIHQLVWRDFYHAVLSNHPHVLRSAHKPEFDSLEWENDRGLFEAWCAGETGFPFVDAGMRQLNATGYMHNRARMVVASFLTKDLLIDWRWGERYFMEKLVDGDPANNNGGWQWAASTGTDAQPYFRIFNPVSQSKKFDADAAYIRRWVPELEGASTALAHEPWKSPLETQGYAERVVDHAERRLEALAMYKAAKARG